MANHQHTPYTRRGFLQTLGAAGIAAGLIPPASSARPDRLRVPVHQRHREVPHPNVVVIVSDDHCWDVMSCMGNPYIQTPNLDRLAGNA